MLFFIKTARRFDMKISTYSEVVDLTEAGTISGKCIHNVLLNEEFGIIVKKYKYTGQRKSCGCVKSIEIGHFDSCVHGCKYCYATSNHK